MKKLLLLPLLFLAFFARAENPLDQYCGKEQYGYIYGDNLYSLPFGQGWQFPKPVNSHWDKTKNGYLGANVYQLQCPLDGYVIALFLFFGIYAYWLIRKKAMENKTW